MKRQKILKLSKIGELPTIKYLMIGRPHLEDGVDIKILFFAQRLKRRSTIFDKLKRQPDMELARMHDIAGCRLIFSDIKSLNEFRNKLHHSWMKHIRRKAEVDPYPYDYIVNSHPDKSGYRGIHDIYQYCARPGRSEDWNNLLVEIQYRTKPQSISRTAL